MAGLCGVVEWAMEGACVHLVSTSGVLGFALSLVHLLFSTLGIPEKSNCFFSVV